MTPEDRFESLAMTYAGAPGVSLPAEPGTRGFGSSALKVHGSIFAMLTRGHLVVKLPAARVTSLIAEGTGAVFDAGKGRPMKEWVTVLDGDDGTWAALADEALGFVSTLRR